MRVHVLSADAAGRVDGTIQAHLLSGFPNVSSSPHDCDVILVPISTLPDFRFNPKLRDIRKPWVLLDYVELEWNYFDLGNPTLLFGKNVTECRWLNPHWHPLDDFVRENPPVVYFKRELLTRDETDKVAPICWPCRLEIPMLDGEDEYNARLIEVSNWWGYSNPVRPRLHGEIFQAMTTHGIGVISEFDHFHGYFINPCARTWASIFAPHYARRPITDIEWLQQRSKMSVSMPGCGVKAFRDSEACVGTLMALRDDGLARSIPWLHGENCIRLRVDHEFEDLDAATKRDHLYQLYAACQDTARKYCTKEYVSEYLMPLISDRLSQ